MQRTYFLVLGAIALHFVTTSSASISIANNHNNSASDLNALRAFKATIFDPQRIIPTNWSTSSSLCNWIGITCNARHHRVAAIDLSYMGIVGTIPPQLGNLSFLVRLNVMNNSFHEHLPTELSRRLTYINLEGNAFEGEPPSWLGGLTALQYSFRDNGFSGSISGRLSNFTKLETVSLGFNFFTGNLSEEFSALPKLTVLDIQHNQLVGPLPWDLFNLSSLQIIGFTNNSLSGYLPAHICNYLPQLQGLCLSLNNFEGEIPSAIGECSRLQVLSLSSNKFRGYIPKGVWNLTTLTQIHLGGTDLTGEIPKVIGNLYNLEKLGMGHANVTGIIPQEVGNLSKLELLNLESNRLRGSIPLKLFNSSTVRVISVAQNDLSGELPSTIGAFLPNLEELYLWGNEFTGTILTSISNASRLRTLELSTNHFTGAIPHSLGNLRLLEQFAIWQNDFSGDPLSKELSFIMSLSNCKRLRRLWLDENPLNGLLPRVIPTTTKWLLKLQMIDLNDNQIQGGNVRTLRYVYLNSNNISSNIPASFWILRDILELDMSANYLTGSLPTEIGSFKVLITLNFSNNQYLGEIPSSIGALQDLQELSLEHKKLQGSIPNSMKNMLQLRHLDLSFNNLEGEIPSSLQDKKDSHDCSVGIRFCHFSHGDFNFFDAVKVKKEKSSSDSEMRLKLREKNLAQTQNLLPMATFERASLHELRQITNGFSESNLLGSGSFGSVYKGIRENGMPSNILLDQDMVGHVCDFGIAKLLGDEEFVVQTKTLATFGYIALEYGLEGLVSTSSDAYTFGIILMDAFMKRKPKDEMFTEELSLRRWVQDCLPDSIIQIIDVDLLHHEDGLVQRKIECILSILQLGLSCTTYAPEERINMKEILRALQKIKLQFIKDIAP
nr:putative receptor-like protein kinase At3g47110 [Coffea arabica]